MQDEALRAQQFSVTHVGRSGWVSCECEAGTISLGIEMGPKGDFSVFMRGAQLTLPSGRSRRVRKDERSMLFDRLRAWLDETGRMGWVIEPVHTGEFVSGRVRRAVDDAIPVSKRGRVLTILAQYTGVERDRVQLAMLGLARGDADELLKLLQAAKHNYLDVLHRSVTLTSSSASPPKA